MAEGERVYDARHFGWEGYLEEEAVSLQGIKRRQRALYCSFCGKGQDEVFKLISGPDVLICDECVAAAQDIITADKIAMGCTAVLTRGAKRS